MIIDCHGHYTTAPAELQKFRDAQLADSKTRRSRNGGEAEHQRRPDPREPREGPAQTATRARHGSHHLSPRASAMAHHVGTESTSLSWSRVCNDLIQRVCAYIRRISSASASCRSLWESASQQRGRAGTMCARTGVRRCNLNPDPSAALDIAASDRPHWYPLYEKMVELDVPAMVHVSSSCNRISTPRRSLHHADTTASCNSSPRSFKDFPTLRFIIPHAAALCRFTGAAIAVLHRI